MEDTKPETLPRPEDASRITTGGGGFLIKYNYTRRVTTWANI